MSGIELAKIIGQKLTEALREYDDFGAHVCYDNPKITITVLLEAMEIEPKRVEVVVPIKTGELPPGTKTAKKSSRIEVPLPVMTQPDKEREEAGLVVPNPERNETTGEVADFKANAGPF